MKFAAFLPEWQLPCSVVTLHVFVHLLTSSMGCCLLVRSPLHLKFLIHIYMYIYIYMYIKQER
jgi:hypothetical protein